MSPRSVLKQRAKDSIKASKPSAALVYFVYAVVVALLEYLAGVLSGTQQILQQVIMQYGMAGSVTYQTATVSPFGSVLALAIEVMLIILGVGLTSYMLRVSRMVQAGFVNLLDGFNFFLRALWLSVLIGLFTFLWSLLLVVPGIIASYRYSQAYYILLDNPDMSAMDCIRASKGLMRGHKWEKFVLDLSFILWDVLCVIPIAILWVKPYYEVTCANYYNELIGSSYEQAPPVYEQ